MAGRTKYVLSRILLNFILVLAFALVLSTGCGGETSGAVTRGLGYESYIIGESIAPGVPVMVPISAREIRLVLKSGNFGQPEFFERAVEVTTTGTRGE